jgi:NAD+ synthase
MQKLITDISIWIKKEVEKADKKGAVLGLSGGLDSTITAFLCKKALGSKKVLGLIMPCHSQFETLEDTKIAVEFLQIPTQHIDLSTIYDTFLSILPEGNKISCANIKPRLRMVTLYYFANKLDYLVVGTGNKSECCAGYFTKYGDGAVDILPLADIYKTELIKLAEYIHVPCKIINKPPSADLWKGQTDEGELGITYKELDEILKGLNENKKSTDIPKQELIEKMVRKSAHKRLFPPIFKKK